LGGGGWTKKSKGKSAALGEVQREGIVGKDSTGVWQRGPGAARKGKLLSQQKIKLDKTSEGGKESKFVLFFQRHDTRCKRTGPPSEKGRRSWQNKNIKTRIWGSQKKQDKKQRAVKCESSIKR